MAIPMCVTRPKGFACATADAFAFSGFDGRVTPYVAELASWSTSNCHGQYLSTDEINRASPDAPNEPIRGTVDSALAIALAEDCFEKSFGPLGGTESFATEVGDGWYVMVIPLPAVPDHHVLVKIAKDGRVLEIRGPFGLPYRGSRDLLPGRGGKPSPPGIK
jgi:hypothetical protein